MGSDICHNFIKYSIDIYINHWTRGLGAVFLGCFVQIPIHKIYKKTIGVEAT